MTAADAQRDRIWEHLLRFGHITEEAAKARYGCSRLSARIGELRDEHGAKSIFTVIGKKVNPHTGRTSRFCECYRYDGDGQSSLF